jgi:hypothetical protein
MLNQNGGIIGPANIPTTTSAKGKWSLAEYYLAKRQNIWPSVTPNNDPYYPYTTLLLPGNGTNGAQNNTFLDGSTNNFTITRNGNTTQGTFSPFSQTGWGNYFNGSSTLSCSSNAKFGFGTGTYSIEAWVYKTTTGSYKGIFTNGAIATGTQNFYISNTETLVVDQYGGTGLATTATISVGVWTHVLVTRDSATNALRIFIDGVLRAYTTSTFNNTSTSCMVGNTYTNDTAYMVGYISNLRVIKGSIPTSYQTSSTTVGTSVFTPSTSALTTSSQGATAADVSLLTCQSNRFIDNSTANSGTGFTITANGSPTVVAFSPFNPSASWSAATYGGSGYFDGNTDYLTAASNAAYNFSGDFTIEAWVYLLSFSQTNTIIDTRNGDVLGAYIFNVTTSQKLDFLFASSGTTRITSTNNVSLNTWTHVVVSRASGTLRLFINGNQEASTTTSAAINALSFPSIGGGRAGGTDVVNGYYLNGYINGLRVLNGTGYSTITVPTAPLTAITNTSLLLNYTNAGIYDATSKNDLETLDNTVNGVRISTTQFKFGGSSIYFDGTGTDYLWIQADQPIQRFGTAPFTIEMWIRLAALGSARGLVAKGTSTTGWLVSLNTSNQVVFTYGTSTITSTGTISQDAWTYIAVVREGTSTNQTKIYIGGVNDGTGTVSTDFTQTSSMYIGANRTGGDLYSGYIQDVRITNGYARTVTTIPTSAFQTL